LAIVVPPWSLPLANELAWDSKLAESKKSAKSDREYSITAIDRGKQAQCQQAPYHAWSETGRARRKALLPLWHGFIRDNLFWSIRGRPCAKCVDAKLCSLSTMVALRETMGGT
jgi:hypothetical protein